MEINVNTINQPRGYLYTRVCVYVCIYMYRANSRLLMPYQRRQSNIKSIVEQPLIQSQTWIYTSLSAYIIVEIHVLTLLWERRVKEDFTVAPAIHRCNTRRHPLPTRVEIFGYSGRKHTAVKYLPRFSLLISYAN